MKSENSIISIENLVKCYKAKKRSDTDKLALDDVSISIPKGSVFGLLGPNGAGKSTTINILAGLSMKTSGKIIIDGIDQEEDPVATRRALGIVPQEVVIDPFFNVSETLEYYAGYFGIPKAERRTDELLDALSLTDKAKTNTRKLSGGMKRRLLIAKALVHNPKVLILDEPTAGVDVELRQQLWAYVRKLNKEGMTVVLTTHYLEEAEELCDHISIINHGKVIASETPQSLIKQGGSKKLLLRFDQPVKDVTEKFVDYSPVALDDHTLSIAWINRENFVNELLDFTKSLNLSINDLSTQEPDLEEVFTALVRR